MVEEPGSCQTVQSLLGPGQNVNLGVCNCQSSPGCRDFLFPDRDKQAFKAKPDAAAQALIKTIYKSNSHKNKKTKGKKKTKTKQAATKTHF